MEISISLEKKYDHQAKDISGTNSFTGARGDKYLPMLLFHWDKMA